MTSAKLLRSSHLTMPITSPVPPCALTVEFCFSMLTNKQDDTPTPIALGQGK